jgi:hypothetical protein
MEARPARPLKPRPPTRRARSEAARRDRPTAPHPKARGHRARFLRTQQCVRPCRRPAMVFLDPGGQYSHP